MQREKNVLKMSTSENVSEFGFNVLFRILVSDFVTSSGLIQGLGQIHGGVILFYSMTGVCECFIGVIGSWSTIFWVFGMTRP